MECNKQGIPESSERIDQEEISFTLVHRKDKISFTLPKCTTIASFKDMVFEKTNIPAKYQKLICGTSSLDNDSLTFSEIKLQNTNGKIMLLGSIPEDIQKVQESQKINSRSDEKKVNIQTNSSKKWFEEDMHKKVIENNQIPEESASLAIDPYSQDSSTEALMLSLVDSPISGLLDKKGDKLRLTVKTDLGQLWLSTYERTNKVSLSTIKAVESQPIEKNKEFSLMYIQLGTTEKSRFFIYYVPTKICQPLKELLLQSNCMA
ncbi:Ubiquitin domain-containing protein ubfd1 [Cichlidogyrus casuarinus]|uniref:Ubiquitin domain-containing protein ubfd1 n=1 Tax=Cichlidogyrus casuarinus TaxID=1844966 RepID=A0ABD2QA15_9PLAT